MNKIEKTAIIGENVTLGDNITIGHRFYKIHKGR